MAHIILKIKTNHAQKNKKQKLNVILMSSYVTGNENFDGI